ncbi:GerMN domain-containing protein [Paenibacillus solani]|uniref:GerMN domain-containing protein n=1 Tax=Paenibacillus solani TaxID=1705565 RepID=UPI003D2C1CE0
MNKKYWMTGLLSLMLVFSAGCGQKPAAAPAGTSPDNAAEQVETTTNETDETAVLDNEKVEDTAVNANKGGEALPQQTAGENTATSAETNVKATNTDTKKAQIKLYYTDPEVMDLKETNREIAYSGEEDKFKRAFEELQKSDDAQLNPLWSDKIKLNSIKFDSGALTLDITKPDEANLGSGGEMFAIEALQKTFFQFEEVKSLELLVDGQQIESLMGHVELEHPMVRN